MKSAQAETTASGAGSLSCMFGPARHPARTVMKQQPCDTKRFQVTVSNNNTPSASEAGSWNNHYRPKHHMMYGFVCVCVFSCSVCVCVCGFVCLFVRLRACVQHNLWVWCACLCVCLFGVQHYMYGFPMCVYVFVWLFVRVFACLCACVQPYVWISCKCLCVRVLFVRVCVCVCVFVCNIMYGFSMSVYVL